MVALTLDAGANDDAITSILATLQGAHVPATFLLTGSFVSRFAATARRIAAAGGGAVMFGVHPASQLAGFAVSVVLATAAMFAIGLLIAAIPLRIGRRRRGHCLDLPNAVLRQACGRLSRNLSSLLQHIGNYTPARRRRPGDGGRDAAEPPMRPATAGHGRLRHGLRHRRRQAVPVGVKRSNGTADRGPRGVKKADMQLLDSLMQLGALDDTTLVVAGARDEWPQKCCDALEAAPRFSVADVSEDEFQVTAKYRVPPVSGQLTVTLLPEGTDSTRINARSRCCLTCTR